MKYKKGDKVLFISNIDFMNNWFHYKTHPIVQEVTYADDIYFSLRNVTKPPQCGMDYCLYFKQETSSQAYGKDKVLHMVDDLKEIKNLLKVSHDEKFASEQEKMLKEIENLKRKIEIVKNDGYLSGLKDLRLMSTEIERLKLY
jgi:hypothetical protein